MVYILHWSIPVDRRREAMVACSEILRGAVSGVKLELYWIAELSEGKYHGLGVLETDSAEALYELFGLMQEIAELTAVPAVGGEQLMELWKKELGAA